jgi:general secretion pathway protein B
MSFILDALKKSENDRQRQSGPALFEVRVAPPRSKFPLLAVIIVSLLVVNLGVVGWLMLREPATAAVPAAQVAPPAPTYPAQQGTAVPPQPGYAPQQPATQGYTPPAGGGYAEQRSDYPAQNAEGGYYSQNPQPRGQPDGGAFGGSPLREPMLADDGGASDVNPDDFEPAREEPAPQPVNPGVRASSLGLPTYEEAATRIQLPELHLDLHSFAADPAKRFVLINMKRMYEGQAMPEGPVVENITTDAAVLSYRGTKFVLNRD